MTTRIGFRLNGEPRSLDVEPSDVLLDVLRERLGVKSPKAGCERGDCGASTVLMDGRSVRSCLILAIEADGHDLTTVEGLGAGELTPLQRAFVERNAFQCGYCAPGIVLAATELLGRNPHPTRDEIREAVAGNLCRCTGYEAIIDAVAGVCGEEGGGR
jgi:carbon-monoxide dehydrogenase small subunit